MRVKVDLNEEEICNAYINSCDGVETLASRYHVGKLRIKDILKKHGIGTKKVGGQLDKSVVRRYKEDKTKYNSDNDGYWVVFDISNSEFETTDVYNRGGVLTTYIKEKYKVDIPTLFIRKKYYEANGKYWWEQWLSYKKLQHKKTKKCPYCDWETIDIENKSGVFEQHLLSKHEITKVGYLKEHPEDKEYFTTMTSTKNLQFEDNESKYVICKICGKRVSRLDWRHLEKHNLTKYEYLKISPNEKTISNSLYQKQKEAVHDMFTSIDNNATKFSSKGELEMIDFIKSKGIECGKNRSILKSGELDIYIPSKKIAIEYNGLKWHSEWFGKKNRQYHLNKTKECNSSGISLIHIFEDEYINKKDIVLSKISHLIGCDYALYSIMGRKTKVSVINNATAKEFLDKYHIQGYGKCTISYGAYHNNVLIAVMSFRNEKNNWELVRFATDYHYRYNGVASKIFKRFTNDYINNINEVKSFADVRWTLNKDNNLYTKLGFKLSNILPPDYTYFNEKVCRYQRFHKFGFRKEILSKRYNLPLTMTETEMIKELGYDRIWNCGLFKYIWKPNSK